MLAKKQDKIIKPISTIVYPPSVKLICSSSDKNKVKNIGKIKAIIPNILTKSYHIYWNRQK